MRRIILILAFAVFSFPFFLQARHIIGGYINYEYLSTTNNINRYRITLRVFRDCGSPLNGGFDRPAELSIATSDGGYYIEHFDIGNPVVTNLTNLFSNPCLAKPPDVCVQEGVYSTIVNLPIDPVNSYYIIYQRCCRNNTIFNILTPGDVGATYYTEITPLAQQLHNSSPSFKTIPPIAVCGNFTLNFDHSAADVDGDSLAYYMVAPLQGGGNLDFGPNCQTIIPNPDCLPPYDSVVYRPPFTSRNPMGGSPAVTINSKTGQLSGVPNAKGQFVVGIRVDEYRNGVLLSSTIRDFQFNVADCEKTVRAELEADEQKGKNLEFRFCGDDLLDIKNTSSLESSIFDYTWEVRKDGGTDSVYKTRNLMIEDFDFGAYSGTMILNKGLQCTDTAFFKFTKFPGIQADFSYDYDTCKAEGVRFTSLSRSDLDLPLTIQWSDQNGSFGTSAEVYRNFPSPGDYTVRIYLTDQNQCRDSLVKNVPYYPIPDKVLELDIVNGCVPAVITFEKLHPGLDETYTVDWDFGDGTTGQGLTPVHEYREVADYSVRTHVVDQFGCEYTGFFANAVRIHSPPVAGFDYHPKDLSNINPGMVITDHSRDGIRWTYQIGESDILDERNPSYVFRDTGLVSVRQIVRNSDGCEDTLTLLIDVVPINTLYLPNAFLPSTEGENSAFRAAGNGFGILEYEMLIFDRYGEIVFRSGEFENGWDGRDKNGRLLPNGVYGVKVRMKGPRGEVKDIYGKATMIR